MRFSKKKVPTGRDPFFSSSDLNAIKIEKRHLKYLLKENFFKGFFQKMWHTYNELNSSVSRGKSQKEHPLSHLFFWLVLLAKFCDHELVFFLMLPLIIWLCRSPVYTKLAASLDKRWGCERTKKSRGISTICEYEKKHSSCREMQTPYMNDLFGIQNDFLWHFFQDLEKW